MEVPKAIFMQVNPIEDVERLMNSFFINTKEYIKENLVEKDIGSYFKIKSYALTDDVNKINTNSRITYVEFKERYVVAGMLETRTALNDLQFTFFRDLSLLEKKIQ